MACICVCVSMILAACGADSSTLIDASYGDTYELGDGVNVRLDSAYLAPELHPGRPSPTLYRFLPESKDKVYAVIRVRVENEIELEMDLLDNLTGQIYAPGGKRYDLSRLMETSWSDNLIDNRALRIPAACARNVVLFVQIPSEVAWDGGLLADVRAGTEIVRLDIGAYREQPLAVGDAVTLPNGVQLTVLRCRVDERLIPTNAEGRYQGMQAASEHTLLQISIRLEGLAAEGAAIDDLPFVTDALQHTPFSMMRESANGKTLVEGDFPSGETTQTLHFLMDVSAADAPQHDRVLLHFAGRCYAVVLQRQP